MTETMGMELQTAFTAVEKLIDEVPEGANAGTVSVFVVMDLVRLLVEEGGYTPEEVQNFISAALKATTVMN